MYYRSGRGDGGIPRRQSFPILAKRQSLNTQGLEPWSISRIERLLVGRSAVLFGRFERLRLFVGFETLLLVNNVGVGPKRRSVAVGGLFERERGRRSEREVGEAQKKSPHENSTNARICYAD